MVCTQYLNRPVMMLNNLRAKVGVKFVLTGSIVLLTTSYLWNARNSRSLLLLREAQAIRQQLLFKPSLKLHEQLKVLEEIDVILAKV